MDERDTNIIKTNGDCQHTTVAPKYNDQDFGTLDEYEVRRRFPRFDGTCPECGTRIIIYSSYMHYIAGDW